MFHEEIRCPECFGYEKNCKTCKGSGSIIAEITPEDAGLVLRPCEGMGDWYVIDRAVHDGRAWMEEVRKGSFSLRLSSRISDADVEGTSGEMLDIAEAIEKRQDYEAYRCAVCVRVDENAVGFWSPRNSSGPGYVTLERADALARNIRETLSRCLPSEISRTLPASTTETE